MKFPEEVVKEFRTRMVGKTICIEYMDGEPDYQGKVGKVTHVDDKCQLYGTWGNGMPLIPATDRYIIVNRD